MTKFLNISTDSTLGGASPSDETVSSQKAIKDYIDGYAISDVTVNGVSVVSGGVAVLPIAQMSGDYGLVKLSSDSAGIMLSNTGTLQTRRATDADIAAKTQINRPIVPANLDLAVKIGVTTNTITLSSAEQTAACNWLGASQGAIKRVWVDV